MRGVEVSYYQPAPNRLIVEWSEPGVVDLGKVAENVQGVREKYRAYVSLERIDGGAVIVYRKEGKDLRYMIRQERGRYVVRGELTYPSEIRNPSRVVPDQVRLVKEVYLRGAVSEGGERVEEAGEEVEEGEEEVELSEFQKMIVEAARRLWERTGQPPSARAIAREIGYRSPSVIYNAERGFGRFERPLEVIYRLAGIPMPAREAPEAAVGARARREVERAEERREVRREAREWRAPEPLQPPEGAGELDARIIATPTGVVVEKEIQVEFLGTKLRKVDVIPLEEPIVLKTKTRIVRIVPYEDTLAVEFWKPKKEKKGK